jgi:hypothetical protein
MPETYNHIGTAYVGRREERADGSYITTEFYVFFDLPIFHLRSYRVWPSEPRFVRRKLLSDFEMQSYRVEPVPLNWRQVRNVYLGSLAVIAAILLTVVFMAALYTLATEKQSAAGTSVRVGIAIAFVLMVAGVIYVIMRGRRSGAIGK